MKLFIWEYLGCLTQSYHDGGGLVIIAEDLDRAKVMNGAIGDTVPDKVYALKGKNEEAMFVFPDEGCCQSAPSLLNPWKVTFYNKKGEKQ